MASFDVIVKLVDQTKNSMRNIEGGLKNVEQQAAKTNKALGSVGSALVAIATSAAAAKIVETAKNFGDLEARIRATSGSGKDTAAVMSYLTDTANRLGISIDDAGKAFSILRANGIDASYKSLETWTKLAISSGRSTEDIADAVANAYQGSFGKISKATEDLITVENKYGSFIVKFRGVVVDTVATSGQAVEAIKKFTDQNAAFADAFDAKSKGTTAALNRLSNALTGNTGFANLDKSVGGLIDKFTNFITGTDGVGRAIGYLSRAINFLGDNFETIATVVEIIGSIFLVGKLFQGIKALGVAFYEMSSVLTRWAYSVKNAGGFVELLGTSFATAWKYISSAWKSLYTQLSGSAQAFTGIADAVNRALFLPMSTIFKNIGALFKNFAAPIAGIVAYVSGLFDPLLEKLGSVYDGVKKIFGLNKPVAPDQSAAETARLARQNAAVPPAAAGTSNPGVPGNTFLQDIIGNLQKAKSEIAPLEKALKKALATGDLSLANKLFEELSSRAEQFGQVIQKDSALIQRDFGIAVAKSTEELRQQIVQYENTALVVKQLANEIEAESISLLKQNILLGQSELMSKKFSNEIMAGANALTERSMRLDDAEFQQSKFRQTLVSTTLDHMEATKTAGLYDAALANGRITIEQYAAAIGQLDQSLLSSTQIQNQALGAAEKEVRVADLRLMALEGLNQAFKSGAVSAKAYRIAAGNLGGDTEEIDRAISVYGTFKDKLIENNEFIKKSITSAATTFSKEFTDAFMQAKSPLEAFKNFFGNILSDIANRMIKQHLADPLAEALTGIANELIGAKGDGKMGKIMTEGMGSTGDTMVETMKGAGSKMVDWMSNAAGGITDIFSGMGDSLGSIFSNVFSWIKDGIGSIGSSLGGLGGGGSMFGDIFGSIGSFLGFADGGRPPVGQASLVGERGPELFVPDSGGTIMPNDQMGGGGNDPLVVNFNLNAIDTMTGTQFLLQNKPAIVNMIGEAYNKRGRRGPLD